MFKKFTGNFQVTGSEVADYKTDLYKDLPRPLFDLLSLHGGNSFNDGLYRIHSFKSSIHWSLLITEFFTNYRSCIYPFGFDWMGRQFCMSTKNSTTLYMFDPATGEDFTLEQDLVLLHDDEFVDDLDNMLSVTLFKSALKFLGLEKLNYNDCLGYKIPLFLGGEDKIDNYEQSDLEVYWHMQSQLYKKSRNLPSGTTISSFRIE